MPSKTVLEVLVEARGRVAAGGFVLQSIRDSLGTAEPGAYVDAIRAIRKAGIVWSAITLNDWQANSPPERVLAAFDRAIASVQEAG